MTKLKMLWPWSCATAGEKTKVLRQLHGISVYGK